MHGSTMKPGVRAPEGPCAPQRSRYGGLEARGGAVALSDRRTALPRTPSALRADTKRTRPQSAGRAIGRRDRRLMTSIEGAKEARNGGGCD